MNPIQVSIIIPNLHSPTLGRTLESLRAQTYNLDKIEVLVVGQDKYNLITEDELVHFIRTDKPVIQAIARNIGVRHARGEILAFIDADCIAASDWVQTIVTRFQDPNVHWLGGGVTFGGDGYWILCDNVSTFYEWVSTAPRGTRKCLASLNFAVRRSAWAQVDGFDESLAKAEDTDLSLRARLEGFNLDFEPSAVVVHKQHPSRNRPCVIMRRAFESGAWTLAVFKRYEDAMGLPIFYRQPWIMLALSPLTALGVVVKMLRNWTLWRFWYVLPAVCINRLLWRWGGVYYLLRGQTLPFEKSKRA